MGGKMQCEKKGKEIHLSQNDNPSLVSGHSYLFPSLTFVGEEEGLGVGFWCGAGPNED